MSRYSVPASASLILPSDAEKKFWDESAIKGADGRRHRVVRTDRGKRLQVVVTARKSGWRQDSATSKPVRVRR